MKKFSSAAFGAYRKYRVFTKQSKTYKAASICSLRFLPLTAISRFHLGYVCNAPPNESLDVRARAATLLLRCPLNFSRLGGDFAPRQFNRSTALLERVRVIFINRRNGNQV